MAQSKQEIIEDIKAHISIGEEDIGYGKWVLVVTQKLD